MRELRQSPNVTELKTHASINVGVVTGKNAFFVVNEEQAVANGLQNYTLPLVGRSAQLKGAIFSINDFKTLVKENRRIYLFYVPPDQTITSLPREVRCYIEQGEVQKFHEGYKCSIRSPWFIVPTVWKPDCFLFRQIYDFPRAVLNQTKATSTDTIHRMKCKSESVDVAASLYTHLTGASAEIEGRSYGGGVLELEPTEAERLLMPMTLKGGLSIEEIDLRIRAGGMEAVLEANDRLILKDKLGFSDEDCKLLKGIWDKMRTRRRKRGNRK